MFLTDKMSIFEVICRWMMFLHPNFYSGRSHSDRQGWVDVDQPSKKMKNHGLFPLLAFFSPFDAA